MKRRPLAPQYAEDSRITFLWDDYVGLIYACREAEMIAWLRKTLQVK